MEAIFIYLLKVNGLIAAFYLGYHLFLQKETFFNSNRWYFLSGLVTAVLLPLLTFTHTIYVEPTPVNTINYDTAAFIPMQESAPTDWILIFTVAYVCIALALFLKVSYNVAHLLRTLYKTAPIKKGAYSLINHQEDQPPFSFFNFIVLNPDLYTDQELESILVHEKIHSQEKHSYDVLLANLYCVLFWFNPIVWLYKKAIIQNLEYIADQKAVQTLSDKKAYQKALLKVVSHQHFISITNHFFQSLIKKRIVMLNTNQSHKKKSWKYALLLPVLVAFMLLFQIETVAQSKDEPAEKVSYAVTSNYSSIVTKNTTDQEIKELEKAFSDEKQKLKISNVKRNSNSEIIAIKLEFDFGKTYNRVMERKSDQGINSIKIYINSDENDELSYGFEDVVRSPINVILQEDNTISKETEEKYMNLLNLYRNGKEIVLILNGEVHENYDNIKIDLNDELGDMKEISPIEFEKKYNKKSDKDKLYYELNTIKKSTFTGDNKDTAKSSEDNGLFLYNMIVETSDSKRNNIKIKEKDKFGNNVSYETTISYETSGPEENIERIKKNKSVDYKKALIIYDGKEISPTELETIDPNSIASVSSMVATEYALKEYGERAKNGVVIIESQAYFKKNNPNLKTDLETFVFKLDNDNDGFVIGKNSRKEDLSFYKTTLARSNISFSFSGIKRNDKGEITAISLNLSKDDVKIKRNFKSKNPIPSLFIGKKNGKIVIEESK